MQIPKELGHSLCGILGACWSDGYPNEVALAEALERVAKRAREMYNQRLDQEKRDRIIG